MDSRHQDNSSRSHLQTCYKEIKTPLVHSMQNTSRVHRTSIALSQCLHSSLSLLKAQYILLILFLLISFFSNACNGLVTTRSILNQDESMDTEKAMEKRAAINPAPSFVSLWEGSTIPYVFDKSFPLRLKRQSVKAMCLWMKQTHCIRFVPRTNETFFLKFVFDPNDPTSCASFVGRLSFFSGRGQTLKLGMQCNRGNIIHELGHALGFYHEHQRPDRDDYVFINYTNIRNRSEILDQFKVKENSVPLGTSYDFESIMHYPTNIFSKNEYETIVPLFRHHSWVIGQRKRLSWSDRKQVNDLYQCQEIDANKEMMILDANIIQDGDWIMLNPYNPSNLSEYHATQRLECSMDNCTVNECAGKLFKHNDVTKCPGNLVQIIKKFSGSKPINSGDEVILKWELSPQNPKQQSMYCSNGNCSLSGSCPGNSISCYDNTFIITSPDRTSADAIMHLDSVMFQRIDSNGLGDHFLCTDDRSCITSDENPNYSFLLQKY